MAAPNPGKKKPIIILSGPVGAGKTSVAKELINILPGPVSHIEGDRFWPFLTRGGEALGVKKNFGIIMASMTLAAIPFALSDYQVILDFSMPPWFLDTAERLVRRREIPLDYVVVRPGEAVCAARAAARSEGRISDYGPYRELYSSFDEAEPHTISDDDSDATIIAAKIKEGLKAGKFRLT